MKILFKLSHLRQYKQEQGVTLIELMIAMTLSLILLAGIVVIMRGSKTSYDTQNDASRIQENARYAMNFIAKDLRMAGYFGCFGGIPSNAPAGFTALSGSNNVQVAGGGTPSSDIVRVVYMDTNQNAFAIIHCPPYLPYQTQIQAWGFATRPAYQAAGVCPPAADIANFPVAALATPLKLGAGTNANPLVLGNIHPPAFSAFVVQGDLQTNDILIASDCGGSDLYTATINGGNLTLQHQVDGVNGLVRTYNNNAQSYGSELRELRAWRYFVAQVNRNGRVYYALCRDNNPLAAGAVCQEANELIEGVENMQIRYGVRNTTANTMQYLTSANVDAGTLWNNVVSVRITLLMQSTEERYNRDLDTHTYDLDPEAPNHPYDPPDDHRIRRVFTTTVMLRNWELK